MNILSHSTTRAVGACRALVLLATGLLPPLLSAQGLVTRNEAALARHAALPLLGAPQLPRAAEWQAVLDLTSEYHAKQQGGEQIILDGETARLALARAAPLGAGWAWRLEVPVMALGGGFMDGFIESWHDTFGLPNGGREFAPRDRYLYSYQRNGQSVMNVSRAGVELGDVRVGLARTQGEGAWRAELKLPTGDADALAGGSLGLALWREAALDLSARWSGHYALGASVFERAGPLRDLQHSAAAFGSLGLGWQWLERLSLHGQLYAHSPLHRDTSLHALEDPGLQLALGGRWHFASGLSVDLGFQEDLIVDSSPDFSLHLRLGIPAGQ